MAKLYSAVAIQRLTKKFYAIGFVHFKVAEQTYVMKNRVAGSHIVIVKVRNNGQT